MSPEGRGATSVHFSGWTARGQPNRFRPPRVRTSRLGSHPTAGGWPSGFQAVTRECGSTMCRVGHFGAEARGRPEAAALPPYAVQRKHANILARWPLARVSIRRIRPRGDLRAALSQPRREVADFNRGRYSAGLGAERTRAVLSERRQDDGSRYRDETDIRCGQTQSLVRRALRNSPLPFFAKLRRQPRRSALPDDQSQRAGTGGDAT